MLPIVPPVAPFKAPTTDAIEANIAHEKGLKLYRLSAFLFAMACVLGFGGGVAGAKLGSHAVSIFFAVFGCFSIVGAAVVGTLDRSKMKK